MNPILILWHFAVMLLWLTVTILVAPFMLLGTAFMAGCVALARHRRLRRERRYSWASSKRYPSGYQRARYGRLGR